MANKQALANAVNEVWTILRSLPSPRDAAKVLAGAHVMLMIADEAKSEAEIRAKLRDVDTFVLESWSKRSGIPLAS